MISGKFTAKLGKYVQQTMSQQRSQSCTPSCCEFGNAHVLQNSNFVTLLENHSRADSLHHPHDTLHFHEGANGCQHLFAASVRCIARQQIHIQKLDKAVYGTLLGAILFYEKLAVQLHDWGYVMNPYNACMFNKMVNGKQITVQFFIGDLHTSCKNMSTIEGLIKDLNNKFKTDSQ